MFVLRVLAEKAREYNTPLYLYFVDLRKAYDSVSHDALWVVLQKISCSWKVAADPQSPAS